jgi:hypothetical protein
MRLTAHFINNNWKLNKRNLNFCPVSGHNCRDFGMVVDKCLFEWEIDNIFTIIFDNTSSNGLTIDW